MGGSEGKTSVEKVAAEGAEEVREEGEAEKKTTK